MFKPSILKWFPSRKEAQEYVNKAEKKEMEEQLKKIFNLMECGRRSIQMTLNPMTVKYLKDKGYTVKSTIGRDKYQVSWRQYNV